MKLTEGEKADSLVDKESSVTQQSVAHTPSRHGGKTEDAEMPILTRTIVVKSPSLTIVHSSFFQNELRRASKDRIQFQ